MHRFPFLTCLVATIVTSTISAEEISLANAPPVVIQTVPIAGTMDVDPATKEIRVTFSKEMADGTWSWTTAGAKDKFPKADKCAYDKEKRTCALPVKLEPGKEYVIGLNWGKFQNFKDKDGTPALPYLLVFKTATK